MNLFIYLIFGHLAGDYLFQNKKMALRKGLTSKYGHVWCFIHTLIYTASIFIFVTGLPWFLNYVTVVFHGTPVFEVIHLAIWFYIFNAIAHYVMDKWSLGQKWLDAIRGRNLMEAFVTKDEYREFAIIFAAIVYVVVDNGIHLMMMWYSGKLAGG